MANTRSTPIPLSFSENAVQVGLEQYISLGRRLVFKRIVDPRPQISIGEEIPADERDEIRHRPCKPRFELQVLQQEDGDQCCPNLNPEGVRRRTHECLDLQVLLDGLEKDLNLPSVFVDGGDGGGGEPHVVRQKLDDDLILLVPNSDKPQFDGTVLSRVGACEADDLVREDIAFLGNIPLFHNFEDGIVFHPCHELNPFERPLVEERIVVVPSVHGDNTSLRQGQFPRDVDLMPFPLRDIHVDGEVPLMVKERVHFHGSLCLPEFRPGEKIEAKINGRGVEAEELALELELDFLAGGGTPANIQHGMKVRSNNSHGRLALA